MFFYCLPGPVQDSPDSATFAAVLVATMELTTAVVMPSWWLPGEEEVDAASDVASLLLGYQRTARLRDGYGPENRSISFNPASSRPSLKCLSVPCGQLV